MGFAIEKGRSVQQVKEEEALGTEEGGLTLREIRGHGVLKIFKIFIVWTSIMPSLFF